MLQEMSKRYDDQERCQTKVTTQVYSNKQFTNICNLKQNLQYDWHIQLPGIIRNYNSPGKYRLIPEGNL